MRDYSLVHTKDLKVNMGVEKQKQYRTAYPDNCPPLDPVRVDEIFEAYYNETFTNDRENEEMKGNYRRWIKEGLLQDRNTVLIFDENDTLVGWGGLDHHGKGADEFSNVELRAITVHPSFQGQGISKKIIETLEGDLAGAKVPIRIQMSSHEPKILESAEKRGYKRMPIPELLTLRGWDQQPGYEERLKWYESNRMEGVIKEVVPENKTRLARLCGFFRKRVLGWTT